MTAAPEVERTSVSGAGLSEPPILLISLDAGSGEVAAIAGTGRRCVRARSGDEACLELQRARPVLVLLDDKVAWLDEGKIVSRLRAHPARGDVPLALLTSADTPPELIENSWRAGLDDCIVRPLETDHLRARLAALCALPSTGPFRSRRSARAVAVAGADAAYRHRLVELLQHGGLHTLEVNDDASMAAFRAVTVDLLIIAADISRADGVALLSGVLKKARASTPAAPLPVVVVSEHGAQPEAWDGRAGGIHVIGRDTPLDDLLRRVRALLSCTPQDLRADSRVSFFCPVEFREAGGVTTEEWTSGYSFNVSSGGIFVRTLVPCRPGSAVEMRIRLTTTSDEMTVTGVVAWSNPYASTRMLSYPVGMGVQFLGAISKKLAQLIELCRSCSGSV
jgi:uncharacterized protein (TIGR02266 family)